MKWSVRIEGEDWSLEDLQEWFSQLAHKIRKEDGKYYLTSPVFEHCTTSDRVLELARQIVEWINGAAKAFEPSFHPVQVGGEIVDLDETGLRRVHQHLQITAVGSARAKGYAPTVSIDGKLIPPQPSKPEKLVEMLEKVSASSTVPRALDAWLLPTTWQRLRHVCEAIREEVAPRKKEKQAWEEMARVMAPMVGMTEPMLNDKLWRFNKTAVKPEHAGSSALHGYTSGPIANPLPFPEAERFIHDLLVAWLSKKIDDAPHALGS